MRQLRRPSLLPLFLAGAVVLWADTGQARAEILLTLAGGAPTHNRNGTYTYTYNAFLTGGSALDKSGLENAANSFTLFDLTGYVPGSALSNAMGFAQSGVSEQLPGVTGPHTPSLADVTFRYTLPTGTKDPAGSSNLSLGTVSIVSTDGVVGHSNIVYSTAGAKNTPAVAASAKEVRLVDGPLAMPGPPAIVMFGSGLTLLGAAFMRRRKALLTLA